MLLASVGKSTLLRLQGCKKCTGCLNSPVRGNYDGLVVLTAITKDILPHGGSSAGISGLPNSNKKNQDRFLDHELYATNLENVLISHFMFSEPEFAGKCVSSRKQAFALGEAISEKPSMNETASFLGTGLVGSQDFDTRSYNKKFHGYVVYVAYRLDKYYALSHNSKLANLSSASKLSSAGVPPRRISAHGGPTTLTNFEQITEENGIDEDDEGNPLKPKSRTTSAIKPFGGITAGFGKGAYDVEDLDDYGDIADPSDDIGKESGMDGDEDEEEEEDEKMLEELEDKQLMARIGSLEGEHKELLEQVKKLEHGRTWVENRLTSLETDVVQIKGGDEVKTKAKD